MYCCGEGIALIFINYLSERIKQRKRRERSKESKNTKRGIYKIHNTETMEQISTKKGLIINRKERVKIARESYKKSRAEREEETIITCAKQTNSKSIHAKINKSEATPDLIDTNNKTILGSNGSPESKWNHGFLLSSSLSEHLTTMSSSNLDEETTISECSRFRVPHNGASENYLFSDEGES